jgi:beta-phosphoglucomutase-like phosphatase (HAD superfamily)
MSHAVVFDFDGVLADTEGLHLAAFQDVFAERGWTLERSTYFERYLGYDDRDMLQLFLEDNRIDLSPTEIGAILIDRSRRFERRVATGQVLFPTAVPAVRRLGEHYKLGIASGSLRNEILGILNANALTPAFGAIVGCDDVARSKPAPDLYRAAVQRLGVDPHNAIAIEDSHWGITSAKSAGLRAIGITTSSAAHVLNMADIVVGSLDEITPEFVRDILGTRP